MAKLDQPDVRQELENAKSELRDATEERDEIVGLARWGELERRYTERRQV